MSARGRPARRDSVEAEIVEALRAVGVFVVYVSGDGCPDLLVRGRPCRHCGRSWDPLEVKGPKGKARAKQAAAQYPLVRTIEEALDVVMRAATRKEGD